MLRRLTRTELWAVGMLLTVWLGLATPTQAAYLPGFTGNTRPQSPDGTRQYAGNFAVLDRLAGGSPGDTFGTGFAGFDAAAMAGSGSAPFDITARYLYLYQDTNPGPGTIFDFLGITEGDTQFASVTSYANWNLLFRDAAGVISLTNSLGADGPYTVEGLASLNPDSPAVVASGGVSLVPVVQVFTATTWDVIYTGALAPGQISRLYGYTSNVAPTLLTTDPAVLQQGDLGGQFPVPSPAVPEPTSAILAGLAFTGLGAFSRYRSRRKR